VNATTDAASAVAEVNRRPFLTVTLSVLSIPVPSPCSPGALPVLPASLDGEVTLPAQFGNPRKRKDFTRTVRRQQPFTIRSPLVHLGR